IYVVITDPNYSNTNGGWNQPSTYAYRNAHGKTVVDTMHEVWVGTGLNGGKVSQDPFTSTFSHEIAETISDPGGLQGSGIWIKPPPNLPASLVNAKLDQIGDYEPEPTGQSHYAYRLNGYQVQPYWSAQDGAFNVPDGNAQTFSLTPQWTN